jgi:hypothetical protein
MSREMTTADIAAQRPEPAAADTSRATQPAAVESEGTGNGRPALVAAGQSDTYRTRWQEIQAHFVDAPQEAVQDADALIAEVMQHLAESFARERSSLEQQWTRGEDVSTEDLRVALTRYRSFFARLLDA